MKKLLVMLIMMLFGFGLVGCNEKSENKNNEKYQDEGLEYNEISKNNDDEKYQDKSVECIFFPDDMIVKAFEGPDVRYPLFIYDENTKITKLVAAEIIEVNESGQTIKIKYNNEIYNRVFEEGKSSWEKEN